MATKTNYTSDALMLFGGGIVGAGLALLLAPQSGRRTRRDIARMGKTISARTDKVFHDAGDRASEILESGRALTREGKRGFMTIMEKSRLWPVNSRG